jgi:hypothetical protein
MAIRAALPSIPILIIDSDVTNGYAEYFYMLGSRVAPELQEPETKEEQPLTEPQRRAVQDLRRWLQQRHQKLIPDENTGGLQVVPDDEPQEERE